MEEFVTIEVIIIGPMEFVIVLASITASPVN
jgi:hypothetical protein